MTFDNALPFGILFFADEEEIVTGMDEEIDEVDEDEEEEGEDEETEEVFE